MSKNLTDLTEVAHWFGNDLSLSDSGDLAVVGVGSQGQVTKSIQRVFRRLMTNPGQYLFAPEFGAGIGGQVGQLLDITKVTALISGQMRLEGSVQQTPAPAVAVQPLSAGVNVGISYTVAPEAIPAVLSFTVEN